MAWKPQDDEKALTLKEFLAIAEKKYPGISRHPELRAALRGGVGAEPVSEALAKLNPVRARANARLRGYQPPLTPAQHTAAFKAHTGVRTRKARTNPRRRTRRNYGPGNSKEALDALFQFFTTVYISQDRPVLAVREMIQNSADAINDPETGSKAQGQIGKNDGRIDITLDRETRTLTVEDNGSGMTPEIICKFTTLSGTTKGKPVTRMSPAEIAANYPPFGLKVRAFARRANASVSGTGPPDGGRYWIRINGIFQFSEGKRQSDYVLPADYVFDYKSPRTAGGFGAAKAVIFFSSTSHPPRWDLHTQDNLYTGQMADDDTVGQVCATTGRAPVVKTQWRQGTKLVIHDLDPALFDSVPTGYAPDGSRRVRGNYEPIEQRIKMVIAANSLPGITITFNGEVIPPMFPNRGGASVQFGESKRQWFDGIFKHPEEAPNPPDYALTELRGKSSNPQGDYPFSKGRDSFLGDAHGAFRTFQKAVEINPEELKKDKKKDPDIVFDPAEKSKSAVNEAVQKELAKGFDTPDMAKFLAEASNAAAGFNRALEADADKLRRQEQARADKAQKEHEIRKKEQGYSPVQSAQEQIRQGSVNTALATQGVAEVAEDLGALGRVSDEEQKFIGAMSLVAKLEGILVALDEARSDQGLDSLYNIAYNLSRSFDVYAFRQALEAVVNGWADADNVTDILVMQEIYNKAAVDGGNGLVDVGSFQEMLDTLFSLYPVDKKLLEQAKKTFGVTNPFGTTSAFVVSPGNFSRLKKGFLRDWQGKLVKDEYGEKIPIEEPVLDKARLNRFVRKAASFVPLLVLWDQTVRLIVNTANVRPHNYGSYYTGFILDDTLFAQWRNTKTGGNLILLNPLATKNVANGYTNVADFAAWLHATACHEIAHMVRGSGHLDGHDERFSVIRENVAAKTLSLIPLIAENAQSWTKLRSPYTKESAAKAKERYKRIAKDVTCPSCLKEAVVSLEQTGRLDTVRWIRDQMGWEDSDLAQAEGMVP